MTEREEKWVELLTESIEAMRNRLNEKGAIEPKAVYQLINRAEALIFNLRQPSNAATVRGISSQQRSSGDRREETTTMASRDEIVGYEFDEAHLGEVEPGDEQPEAPCDYCGMTGHLIEACPLFERDRVASCERDAATDKSDWPL